MDYIKDDRYVQQIYERAIKTRTEENQKQSQRLKEDMEKKFWEYLPIRLERLIKHVLILQQNPKIPRGMVDEAEREVSKLLDIVQINTLPEVIDQLTMDLQKKKYVEKLK